MTGKYIDLAEQIARHTCCSLSSPRSEQQSEALRWLDEHPEAVPGRTITESQADRLWYDANNSIRDAWSSSLANEGITVVPDPEPTNAERLADYVRQINRTAMSAEECGEWLDAKGVQAPEGDGQ